MIEKGSTVILHTEEAIYSPCKVTAISSESVTITYFAGTKRDRKTGEYQDNHLVETISRKKIVSLLERT